LLLCLGKGLVVLEALPYLLGAVDDQGGERDDGQRRDQGDYRRRAARSRAIAIGTSASNQ
jgi:hypothetical protein